MIPRLSEIDELTRGDHTFLEPADRCYYVGEYTARAGYAFSSTNNLIINLKKPLDRRGLPEWKWKSNAISTAARSLRTAVPRSWLESATFVPAPPSKVAGDPGYDDRLVQVLRAMARGCGADIRELILCTESATPAHLTDRSRNPASISRRMRIEESLALPAPGGIVVFDDVLTTGATFKAVQGLMASRFPGTLVVGLFLARRVPDSATPG